MTPVDLLDGRWCVLQLVRALVVRGGDRSFVLGDIGLP